MTRHEQTKSKKKKENKKKKRKKLFTKLTRLLISYHKLFNYVVFLFN